MSVSVLALTAGAAGCTSRTLPLPPPAIDRVAANGDGTVAVSGFALAGSYVGVINEDRETGVVVVPEDVDCEDRCPFQATLPGEEGQTLRIWQFFDTSSSSFHTVDAP